MTNLLVLREQLKKFYSKYETFITPAIKFALAYISLTIVNKSLGYMITIDNISVVAIVALMCSFMPMNFIPVVSAGFALAHIYAFSLECAVVTLAVFLVMFLLYFRFSPKYSLAILLTPLCFVLKIPYVVPVALGLIGGPAGAVATGCGVVIYYVIDFMDNSVAVINTFDADGMIPKFRYIVDGMLGNRQMIVAIVGFTATIIVVYIIRRLSVDHAWTIATVTGLLLNILIFLFGDLIFNTKISIVGLIFGSIAAFLIIQVLQFFIFNVDYSRTEMVQFEDDEYYYYVKAIPKNTVATPEKRVKTIRVPEKVVNQNKSNTQ